MAQRDSEIYMGVELTFSETTVLGFLRWKVAFYPKINPNVIDTTCEYRVIRSSS